MKRHGIGRCVCGEKQCCSSPAKCECVCHGFKSSDSKFKRQEAADWWSEGRGCWTTTKYDQRNIFVFSSLGMLFLNGARHLTPEELAKVEKMDTFEMVRYMTSEKKRWALVAMDSQKSILFCDFKDGLIPDTIKYINAEFDRMASIFAKEVAEKEAEAAKAAAKAAQAAADAQELERQRQEAIAAREAREAAAAEAAAAGAY